MMVYNDDPRSILCHFNPYHDPQTGQFTKSTMSQKVAKYLEKKVEKADIKRQTKLQQFGRIESRAEKKAYSPLSSYSRAEKIMGEQLRKKREKAGVSS